MEQSMYSLYFKAIIKVPGTVEVESTVWDEG